MSSIDFNIVHRPLNFKQIIGNSKTKTVISNAISKGTFQKVSIFAGAPGIGKSTFAKVIASALQCTNSIDGSPCLKCPTCREIQEKLFLKNESNVCNIFLYNMAKSSKKEDAEEIIQSLKYKKLTKYNKRIFILEEPQNMSPEAQDTMLTTLEYLPDDTHVIFCTTDLYKMKNALVSRAQPVYKLQAPPTDELVGHLEGIIRSFGGILEEDRTSLKVLCKINNNKPRDCISTLQTLLQTYGYISEELMIQTLDLIPHFLLVDFFKACSKDIVFIYQFIDKIKDYNISYSSFVRELLIFTKDAFKLKSGVVLNHYSDSQVKSMKSLFSKYTYKEYIRLYEEISKVNLNVLDINEDLAESELITLALRITSDRFTEKHDSTNEERKCTEAYTNRKSDELKAYKPNDAINDITDILSITNKFKNEIHR
ncbi:ATP-binding protein [Clostridium tertium]|uniref:DNA polymerase III subunit n=1 Tax=Clostridium tertium TaxID=1559 RepID=UPI0023B308CE|nr:AAA family ATPase [Clostridium tertium]